MFKHASIFRQFLTFILLLLTVFSAGCSLSTTTTDKASDAPAAQNFLPKIEGYNVTNAASLKGAIETVTGGAALLSGNAALAAVIAKIDSVITCYQSVGAVAANIYTERVFDITSLKIPKAGVVALINQDRLRNNFLACLTGGGNQAFSAQGAGIEPCVGSGDFVVNKETISYLYAATDPAVCSAFEQHFTAIKAIYAATPTQ